MAFFVPALALLGRVVQDAGLQVFGVLSAPTGWELGSQDSCGASRPQQTELCVCCKQDISLQGLTGITGQQKEPCLVREVNTDTISDPHNKHLCRMENMGERDGGVMTKGRKGITHL